MLNKVVIPVAGLGTRVLPASKAIAKEMLPVVDKPVIQYVIEEAAAAGLTEIILVSRGGKSAIEDHFDIHYELEAELARKDKTELLDSIQNTLPKGLSISTVRQGRALGLGHAVLCAATPLVGDDDFVVILPDMLIPNFGQELADLSQMVARYNDSGIGQIMVEEVDQDKVERYGIVDCNGANPSKGNSAAINRLVEKPRQAEAPSNLSINGRYILPNKIMSLLRDTQPGAGGEIQLTDALDSWLSQGQLMAYNMRGKSYDCGNKSGYLEANIIYGLEHPETKDHLKQLLKQLQQRQEPR